MTNYSKPCPDPPVVWPKKKLQDSPACASLQDQKPSLQHPADRPCPAMCQERTTSSSSTLLPGNYIVSVTNTLWFRLPVNSSSPTSIDKFHTFIYYTEAKCPWQQHKAVSYKSMFMIKTNSSFALYSI
jgi:hypothetical protein